MVGGGSICNVFIFLGPPGSGKGSISQLCTDKLGWVQLSPGNLCRQHIANATPIGQQIAQAINAGSLAPDELICQMVFEWLAAQRDGHKTVIIDGFPRTVLQATIFDQFLKENADKYKLHVVKFKISDQQVLTRIIDRLICSNVSCQAVYSAKTLDLLADETPLCTRCAGVLVRRKDDAYETAQERLKTYHRYEHGLEMFYDTKGEPIHSMDAAQSIDDVFNYFVSKIATTSLPNGSS
jgi:adenylate kinase